MLGRLQLLLRKSLLRVVPSIAAIDPVLFTAERVRFERSNNTLFLA